MPNTTGTFTVELSPLPPEGGETWARMALTKTWSGGLEGTGRGLMMSAGDPQSGHAGYVAIETVDGRLDGRAGGLAFQQNGVMSADGTRLEYEVVPGSGTGELAGITGTLHLTVDDDGTHRYDLDYALG